MQTAKRAAGMVLALSMLLTFAPPLQAADAVKEEIVYGLLAGDGEAESVYIVNTFELAEPGEIVDYGSYEQVTNLTTTDPIEVSGDTIRVSAPSGRFYYQGNMGAVSLPWEVKITYTLDGSPITADELAGRTGALAMRLQIAGDPEDSGGYADHYALQVTVTLDMERCADITAEGATLANSGSSKLITLMGLPGEAVDCTIRTNVHDFEMTGIQIAGVPLTIALDNLQSDELDDQLGELTDGLRELDDGVGELKNGTVELKDGTAELRDGVAELYDGVGELYDGSSEFCDGIADYRNGLAQYLDGVLQLGDGIREAASGAGQLADGLQQAAGNGTALAEGAEEMANEVLTPINAALRALGLSGQALTLENYPYMISLIEDQLEGMLGGDFPPSGGEEPGGETGGEGTQPGEGGETDTEPPNPGEMPIPSDINVSEILSQLEQAKKMLEFCSGIISYTSGISQIAGQMPQLASGLSQAAEGFDELEEGGDELYDGTWELEDGAAQLRDGIGELRDGVAELRDGTVELDDGVGELVDGVGELKDGTGEIREQVTTDEIEARIEEMLDEYTGGDFDAPSFVDARNTVDSVQFVLMTRGISLPAAEIEEPEPEPESFWDRLLALFGF